MTKKYRVKISRIAERDIQKIKAIIARDKPLAAEKWVLEIKDRTIGLTTFPERHEIIPEAADLGVDYRHALYGPYRVLYRIEQDEVTILRVIHSAQILGTDLL